MCVFLCFGGFLRVFACFSALGVPLGAFGALLGALGTLLGRSWGALGALLGALGALLRRSWSALGRSWDALGALLGKNTKKSRGGSEILGVLGRGFGRVLAILNVLVKSLRLHKPSHRFFYFFCIVRELLAKARTLNFVAPVDVL